MRAVIRIVVGLTVVASNGMSYYLGGIERGGAYLLFVILPAIVVVSMLSEGYSGSGGEKKSEP